MSALRILVAESPSAHRLADVVANDPAGELAGVAGSARHAVTLARRMQPDAILMSSAVAGGGAIEATREIMTVAPAPIVVVLDDAGAPAERARTELLAAGALAAVPFPDRSDELRDLLHSMAAVGLVRRRPPRAARPPRARRGARVVAIGASTGGPATLRAMFAALPAGLDAPVLVTQHISSGFSDGMVNWWNAAGPLRAKIAEDGEQLAPGTIYVAPDDRHLTISPALAIAISDAPPSGGHRPSASVMFRSAAERFGAGTLAVILTGMGRDGVDGLAEVRRAGGRVYAQDEASCAVFGMPKAAIDAGLADFILPPDAISRHIADAVAS